MVAIDNGYSDYWQAIESSVRGCRRGGSHKSGGLDGGDETQREARDVPRYPIGAVHMYAPNRAFGPITEADF